MDRQSTEAARRQRQLFAQADAARAAGNHGRARQLEEQAARVLSFYD